VLGFGYWWLAVRMFPPQAIGFASAAISAMTLLGTIGILGLGTLLVGELPRQAGNEGPLISTALLVAGAVVGCLGIAFAIVAPLLSTDFQRHSLVCCELNYNSRATLSLLLQNSQRSF
jgi:O-antigen/teichoic acid export membrane protein